MKYLINWADKFEDRVRHYLSRRPITYTLIGGIGIVLFYRGVWHWADYLLINSGWVSPAWDGPVSLFIALIILLSTGIFVSSFIGEHIIISGLKGEKKVIEKTREELIAEEATLNSMKTMLNHITEDLAEIKAKIRD